MDKSHLSKYLKKKSMKTEEECESASEKAAEMSYGEEGHEEGGHEMGGALSKYLSMNDLETPEHDYVEAVSDSPLTDADEAPGAHEAEEMDPIRGKKGPQKRKAGQ